MKTVLIAALLTIAPLAASAAEITGDATFGWHATGSTYMVGENHPFFVGAFTGVLVTADPASSISRAATQCPGYNDIGVGAAGYCITTDKDGDTYITKWTCTAIAPVAGAIAACEGTGTFSAGTGKYANASGGDTFKAYTTVILADGTATGYSEFTDFKLTY